MFVFIGSHPNLITVSITLTGVLESLCILQTYVDQGTTLVSHINKVRKKDEENQPKKGRRERDRNDLNQSKGVQIGR